MRFSAPWRLAEFISSTDADDTGGERVRLRRR
jgi:hypothetical protein